LAKIYLKRIGQSLVPADEESLKIVEKLSKEETYEVPIKKSRNYLFHKKFFSLVNKGFDNTFLNCTFEKFRDYCMIGAGHCTTVGGYAIPDSIAFDKMDDIQFEKVYNDVLQFIILHINVDQKTLENELGSFL